MSQGLRHFKYEFELKPGEKFQVAAGLVELLGAGRWVFTIEPADYYPWQHDAVEDDSVDESVKRKRREEMPF